MITANFFQQVPQGKNYFDTKEDISEVTCNDLFYKLETAPHSVSLTHTSKLTMANLKTFGNNSQPISKTGLNSMLYYFIFSNVVTILFH